jgi:hypothetical protein
MQTVEATALLQHIAECSKRTGLNSITQRDEENSNWSIGNQARRNQKGRGLQPPYRSLNVSHEPSSLVESSCLGGAQFEHGPGYRLSLSQRRAANWTNRVRFPAVKDVSFSSPQRPDRFWGPSSLPCNEYWGFFPRVKAAGT